jgi:hypothetical protein
MGWRRAHQQPRVHRRDGMGRGRAAPPPSGSRGRRTQPQEAVHMVEDHRRRNTDSRRPRRSVFARARRAQKQNHMNKCPEFN